MMDVTYFGLTDSKTSIDVPESLNHVIFLIAYLHYGLRGTVKNPDARKVVSFNGFFRWK